MYDFFGILLDNTETIKQTKFYLLVKIYKLKIIKSLGTENLTRITSTYVELRRLI